MVEKILITAALPYINNVPHMGHIVGSHLPADIQYRHAIATGKDAIFIGGSDQHGTPAVMAAKQLGVETQDLVDKLHEVHKKVYAKLNIAYTNYSNTANPNHHQFVQEFFETIHRKGFTSTEKRDMYYCENEQMFLPDRYVIGTCPTCNYEAANADQCEECATVLSTGDLIDPTCYSCGEESHFKETEHVMIQLGQLFRDTYGFSGHDFRIINEGETLMERVRLAAEVLFRRVGIPGVPTHVALSAITSQKIAALATKWDSPYKDTRRIGSTISRAYKHHPQKKSEGVTNMSLLRQEIMQNLDSDFTLNMFNEKKCVLGLDYSRHDQRVGLKTPFPFGVRELFLMGVYRSDGNPYLSSESFILHGQSDDVPFYENVLECMIEDSFNLNVRTRTVERERNVSKKDYSWTDVVLSIGYQGHFEYLRDTVGLFNEEGIFQSLLVEYLTTEDVSPIQANEAYLMGMIAGRANIGQRDERVLLQLNDSSQRVIPEFKRVLDVLGLEIPYYHSDKKPRHFHINQTNLQKLLEYEPSVKITDSQKGLLVNPKHLFLYAA